MPDEARLVGAFLASLLATLAITPLAIRVAIRVGFYDEPVGYKAHGRATPYLGGAAVLLGFLIGALLPGEVSRLALIPLGALALWAVGTADDRLTVPPGARVAIELAVAGVLYAGGLGWSVFGAPVPDFLLTALWVVGLVNAFNLMDNMDGATSTIGALSSAATAGFALVLGDPALAVFALALAGACLGFLRYNLAAPARIFLGDGGSMTIGFLVAALIMALPLGEEGGAHRLLAAVLLAGLPILDTTLVLVSRRRAGVSFLQGGRDHLTHRLRSRLPSARAVALALAAGQFVLCLLAFGVARLGDVSVVLAWTILLCLVAAGIGLLESAAWAPARPILEPVEPPRRWWRARSAAAWRPRPRLPVSSSTEPPASEASRGPTGFEPARARRGLAGPRPQAQAPTRPVELVLVVAVAAVAGLSPLFYGFYDISSWGPIALVLLAVLFGLVVARPALPRAGALIAVASLTGLWALSLVSTAWAESGESALTDANRWMLYAALLAILVLLLRDDRIGRVLLGTTTLLCVGVALYLLGSMLGDGGTDLFAYRRLHNPLGYANGEAAYFLLGIWPLLAVAERARHAALAGAALGLAVPLLSLVVLSQSRAAVLALVVAAVVVLVAVPGRRRRAWGLVVLGGGVAAISGPLTAVFGRPVNPNLVSASLTREAAAATLIAAAGVAIVWALARGIEATIVAQAPSVTRPLGIASAGILSASVLAGAVALASAGDPAERIASQYRAFTRVEAQPAGPSRFASGGGTRAEYWRVARNQFRANPLRGVGAGNYRRTYFLERRISEDVTQPHSLPIQALAELGVLGGLAVAGLILSVLAGFGRRAFAGRRSPANAGLAVAAGGAFIAWLVHTSVDWLHLIPGVTGVAICAAAVLVGPWAGRRTAGAASRATQIAVIASALLIAFAAVQLGRSTLADLNRRQAREALAAEDAQEALRQADEALALDGDSLRSLYLKSAAYARQNDYPGARGALLEAARREPHNFVPWGLLGDLATRRGDLDQAARDRTRALSLNPRDPSLNALRRQAPPPTESSQ